MQAAEQHTVVRFPTKRKARVRNVKWEGGGNVVPIQSVRDVSERYDYTPPIEPVRQSPELAMILSILDSMSGRRRQKVLKTISRMSSFHTGNASLASAARFLKGVL